MANGGEKLYRYVVVGAGSAGCALAARLSEDPGSSVLLLEAGGSDWSPMLKIPLAAGKAVRQGRFGWLFETEPSPGLAGRRQSWPRGRVLGGTSSINGMVYIRGNRADYDEWAASGNRGWSHSEVLPYFKRSEGHAARSDAYHGTEGPLRVTRGDSDNPLYEAFVDAGTSAGFPRTEDFNGAQQEGFGRYDFTIHAGRRSSSATAFLTPARNRPNLAVVTWAVVHRIIIRNGRATGVEFVSRGSLARAHAEAEVVLCAGSIASPHILMHSGVGDPAMLETAGVRVVHALPSVGQNLQDHNAVALRIAANAKLTLHGLTRVDRMALAMGQALLFRTGPAVRFPCEAGAFTRLTESAAAPDVQWHFFLGMSHSRLRIPGWTMLRPDPLEREGFTIGVYVTRPQSRGYLRLRSADPRDPLLIYPNALGTGADLDRLVEAVEQARRVAAQPALGKYSASELVPGPAVRDHGALAEWVRNTAGTVYHPVGTCRMGQGADAVVGPDLRVRGIARLRVADASIMPTITRGNTNAPAIMIAEKCADMMLDRAPPVASHVSSYGAKAPLAEA